MLDESNAHPPSGRRKWWRRARRVLAFLASFSWLRELLLAVALAFAIITFLYQPVKVEGTSMAPVLVDQERIFVNKFIYHLDSIHRGDVIVFRYPRDPGKSFIKRVVGLPGETIELSSGRVLVNGEELAEDYLVGDDGGASSQPPLRVPPEHYYVLGDNRASSNDSRTWGTVHRRYIYGRAVFAYWPPDRFGWLTTSNRRTSYGGDR